MTAHLASMQDAGWIRPQASGRQILRVQRGTPLEVRKRVVSGVGLALMQERSSRW